VVLVGVITAWAVSSADETAAPGSTTGPGCALVVDAATSPDGAPVFRAPGLLGGCVDLARFRGRPTVVNFWASYCTPCLKEMPAFEEVYQELDGEDVAFLGLAVNDRVDDALQMVEQTGVTYPTAQDKDASVITALEGIVLPTTVLLDADGNVVADHSGELTADELRRLLSDELGIET
jgi:cytochrome c biogenesis protein CcmG, thiol:disulfide interchange protein DsbE